MQVTVTGCCLLAASIASHCMACRVSAQTVWGVRLQAEAERRKRAQILESEGVRQSRINVAEGDKAQVILTSEAAKQDAINRAVGTR